jgi:hypothetical protein
VIDVAAAQRRAAQAVGDMPDHLEPGLEALTLVAMSAGLGTSVLVGQSSALKVWPVMAGQTFSANHVLLITARSVADDRR